MTIVRRNWKKSGFFLFPILTGFLMHRFMHIPDVFNYMLVAFLAGLAILDRLNARIFGNYHFSFFLVIAGLLIFDDYSIFYSVYYFLADHLYIWLKRKSSFISVLLPSISINIIVIIIGNEYYNSFVDKSYAARYLTLIVLLGLNILLNYIFQVLETGKISTALILNAFAVILFESLIVFPLLAEYNYFNYEFIVLLFLFYYLVVGFLHVRFKEIGQEHVQYLLRRFQVQENLDIFLMDMGSLKGACYPIQRIIAIDEKLDYPEQLQTLVHEYFHFILWGKIRVPRPIQEILVTLLEAVVSWYYILTLKGGSRKGV